MPFHPLIGTMPSISLKLIVIVHWLLVIWALLGWGPAAFVWCNVTVLAVGVWAIGDRQSVDALFMFIVMHLMSIVVDIVVLSLGFPHGGSGAAKFSAGMCILNLILKPFSTILLYQMYRDRGGEYNINFGANNTAYDHIGDDSTGSSADFRNVLNPSQHQQQQQRPPQYQQSNNQYGGGGGSKEQPLV